MRCKLVLWMGQNIRKMSYGSDVGNPAIIENWLLCGPDKKLEAIEATASTHLRKNPFGFRMSR